MSWLRPSVVRERCGLLKWVPEAGLVAVKARGEGLHPSRGGSGEDLKMKADRRRLPRRRPRSVHYSVGG